MEINEKSLLAELEAFEGRWSELPFSGASVPEGHSVKFVMGVGIDTTWLASRYLLPCGSATFDGTHTIRPTATVVKLPAAVAEAAFTKGAKSIS